MATVRKSHTATRLPNGKVLIVGGSNDGGTPFASAEIYDPATDTFSATGSLGTARSVHSAQLLPNGNVLVAGGYNSSFDIIATTEIYNFAAGTWSAGPSMSVERRDFGIVKLSNGKIMLIGGLSNSGYNSATDIYDYATNTMSATGAINTARRNFASFATWLGDIFIAGGSTNAGYQTSAERYLVSSSAWTTLTGGSSTLAEGRDFPSFAPTINGKILIASGYLSAKSDLYDPVTNTLAETGSMAGIRGDATATFLPANGKVLVVGGSTNAAISAAAYLYQ
jgi:hypothetical protein